MIAIIFAALALASSLPGIPAAARITEVTIVPPETVQTSTYYDTTSRKLTIKCDVASRGLCRFTVVDGVRMKAFVLRPKTRLVVGGVSNKARVCATGRNPGLTCNLNPVSG